jgi:cyclophilin family peptidyl-prolyl cis-trans isomerase
LKRYLLLAIVVLTLASPLFAANPRVQVTTNMGSMVIELYPDKAPKSVANFLAYVKEGFYNGTVFHRVIPGFMIQGGGMTADLQRKQTKAAIPNEADNGLSNDRGTVAMARLGDPDSATAQFFINLVDNKALNFKSKSNGTTWGYAVFGKVVQGMDVVDKIAAVSTTTSGQYENVPAKAVTIQKVTLEKSAPQSKPAK